MSERFNHQMPSAQENAPDPYDPEGSGNKYVIAKNILRAAAAAGITNSDLHNQYFTPFRAKYFNKSNDEFAIDIWNSARRDFDEESKQREKMSDPYDPEATGNTVTIALNILKAAQAKGVTNTIDGGHRLHSEYFIPFKEKYFHEGNSDFAIGQWNFALKQLEQDHN